ncbi:TonB-dependent receptor family protein [Ferruginibacter lapsinanis]|uniref:outer membrane beta-barrel family protein n=1 Tax=Ferruginibacter lapsinanis TaxID=563172 RepID=UPI001E4284DB|nr:outer membrane beta-barrel family protein [Ferruginibacter lapsinanis]UEG51054.1 TonB-dependent receptor family protein [Ferruginibacter lapsinanis]
MKQVYLCLLCIGCLPYTNAQKISGIVKNNDSVVLVNASVSLLHTPGSKICKLGITNAEGKYAFEGIESGKYVLNISAVGYKSFISSPIVVNGNYDILVPVIFLPKKSISLKEVFVKSDKPILEISGDKMVVNVENTINAVGSDALELIRKSPGVTIDKDDNISMGGKSGVQIFIDGKPSPVNKEDLSDYLKSIQSTQIESLELITNPSAKYEAAGNAGVINIRMIKNKTIGTNSSINAGYGIGIYGKYNGGISINHRNKKVNIFGSYNINHALNITDFRVDRIQLDTLFDLVTKRRVLSTSSGFKAGVDYFINPKNTIGFLINGSLFHSTPNSYSTTPITYIPGGTVNKILISDNMQTGHIDNVNFNGNYKYLGKDQHQLNIDLDYGFFHINRDLYQPNVYYDNTQTTELSSAIYSLISGAKIDIYSLKTDYELPFKKGVLGFGIKNSYVESDNNFERYNLKSSLSMSSQLDTSKSNQFNYKEYINAGYINYNKNWKSIQLQVGLRAENTQSRGKSYPIKSDGMINYDIVQGFTRSYTNFFPSVSVSFVKNADMTWNISAGRRVDRPNYQDLNPFEFKLDEYTFRKGNTELVPQYSYNIGVTNTYKNKLISKLSYSLINDLLGQLVDTIDRSKNFLTVKNIAQQKLLSLFESYHYQHQWYSGFFNANIFYTSFNADFGGGNRVINTSILSYVAGMQNNFRLGSEWTAELAATFTSPTYVGTIKSYFRWGMDIGAQKNILKGKGNFKFSVTDIFFTNIDKGYSAFAGQSGHYSFKRESRQFKINFSYRIGNKQVKAESNRTSGSEEEIKRSQNGGG